MQKHTAIDTTLMAPVWQTGLKKLRWLGDGGHEKQGVGADVASSQSMQIAVRKHGAWCSITVGLEGVLLLLLLLLSGHSRHSGSQQSAWPSHSSSGSTSISSTLHR